MDKIDSIRMLIQNKIVMLKKIQKKYNPYGSDVAIYELEELLNAIDEFSEKTDKE